MLPPGHLDCHCGKQNSELGSELGRSSAKTIRVALVFLQIKPSASSQNSRLKVCCVIFVYNSCWDRENLFCSFQLIIAAFHFPDPHSRVCLTSDDEDDPLSSYINANYIRVRLAVPENLSYISGFVRPLLFFNRVAEFHSHFSPSSMLTETQIQISTL